ncbi:GAP family protein [Paeniglutamicibacter kerguelensis]|nr:GAP family protein [Paeniglutamicibacter kerguelensis]
MLSAIGAVVPLAVAAALSSVPILAMIALLLSEKGRSSAPFYLVGWIVGLFGVAGLFALGLSTVSRPSSPTDFPVFGALEIIIGIALLVFGVVLIVRQADTRSGSSWAARLAGISPVSAAGLGVALNLRPKAVLLAAAAGLAIGTKSLSVSEGMMALAVYTAIGGSSVAIPVLASLVRPDAMEPRLRQVLGWLERNQHIVAGVVVLLVGALITGNGFTHLAG